MNLYFLDFHDDRTGTASVCGNHALTALARIIARASDARRGLTSTRRGARKLRGVRTMNAIGKSSVVFVTLSGLFWGGWILGSQTPEGQEAIARAYIAAKEEG